MLRWLASTLIVAPFTLIVLLFAVSNRQMIDVALFPLPGHAMLPLYLLVLTVMALSFFVGALLMWVLGLSARVTARRASKRVAKLELELAELRAAALRADAAPLSGGSSSVPSLSAPLY